MIPLGVDLQRFRSDATAAPRLAEPRPVDGPRPVTVGFVGRLVPEKGADILIDAVARDPHLRARIVGGGPAGPALRARADELDIADRVEFMGPIEPDDIADFYHSLDVLAVPSLPTPTWTEQFGRVAVEAMASGVPVVSSDAGALPAVVGGAGIVVPAGDAGALALGLVEAAGQRRDELRSMGLARAAECSWEAVGRDYLELYRSVVHTPSVGSSGLPPVEVIVVAYGTPELLRRALEPVAHLPVTVVDNSSLPEIEELCTELGVRYLDPGHNDGFAAGVNFALRVRLVPGADVLLLNPDAVIATRDVHVLQQALRAERDLASVGPEQVDGTGVRSKVEWPFPSPLSTWLEAAGLARFHRAPRFVIGSVLLLRAEAIDQVGEFDERFFLYSEETDWAYRASRLGWRHASVPGATALHVGAATSNDAKRREAHFHASIERYLRKHYGSLGWQSARIGQWLGAMTRSLVLRGERGREARRRAALYRLGPVRVESRLGREPDSARSPARAER